MLAEHDDALLAAYVDGSSRAAVPGCTARWPPRPARRCCTRCTPAPRRPARASPTSCEGSRPCSRPRPADAAGEPSGPGVQGGAGRGGGEGRLRPDVPRRGPGPAAARPPAAAASARSRASRCTTPVPGSATTSSGAGRIGRLHGLSEVRVGDAFGEAARVDDHHFAPPTLEASVTAVRREQGPALRAALAQLADQDPLIDVRTGDDGLPDRVALRPRPAGGDRGDAGRGARDRRRVRRRRRAPRRAAAPVGHGHRAVQHPVEPPPRDARSPDHPRRSRARA